MRLREAGRSVAGLRCLEQPRSCTISDWCLCVMHGGGGSCHVVLGGMIFLACVLLSWLIEVDWIGIGIGRGRTASRLVRYDGQWTIFGDSMLKKGVENCDNGDNRYVVVVTIGTLPGCDHCWPRLLEIRRRWKGSAWVELIGRYPSEMEIGHVGK